MLFLFSSCSHRQLALSQREATFSLLCGGLLVRLFVRQGDYAKKIKKKKKRKRLLNGFSRPGRGPTEPFQFHPGSRRQNGSNHVLSTSLILPGCHSLFNKCYRGNNDQQHDVRQASLRLVSAHCELFRTDQKKKKDPTKVKSLYEEKSLDLALV